MKKMMKGKALLIVLLVGVVQASDDESIRKKWWEEARTEVNKSVLLFERACEHLEEEYSERFQKKIKKARGEDESKSQAVLVEEWREDLKHIECFKKKIGRTHSLDRSKLEFQVALQDAVDSFDEKYPSGSKRKRSEVKDIPIATGWGGYCVSRTEFIAWQLFHNPLFTRERVEEELDKNRQKEAEAQDTVFE